MSDITLSKGVRQNLLSLQGTAELLNRTQERLSTGKKVNSALDNPVNFFTSSSLQARANDLSRLLDSVGNAVQTLQEADKGISAITKLIESAQAVANQAKTAADPTASYATDIEGTVAIAADTAAVATGDVAGLAGTDTLTSLGIANGETITISDGTNTVTHTVVDATTEDVDDVITSLNGGAATWTVAVNGGFLEVTSDNAVDTLTISGNGADSVFGTTTSAEPANATLGALAGTLTFQLGTGTVATITFGTNDGAGEVNNRAELAAALTAAGTTSGLTLTINGSNEIDVASTSEDAVTIGGTGSVLTALGLTAGSTNPTATSTTASDARTDLQAQYNTLLTQITQLAGDASFNGINLLDGDALTVTFNEDGSSTLTITGVDFSATGLGLNAPAGDGFQVDANIDTAVDELSAALSELRTQAAAFGSNMSIVQARQEFTKNTINVLQIGADNLTLADTNEESANMLALQTRQQLSTVALSLASQADQAVLRLF